MKKSEVVELVGLGIGLALQYGVPAAIDIIQNFNKEEITLDDVRVLKGMVKPPEEYFPGLKSKI